MLILLRKLMYLFFYIKNAQFPWLEIGHCAQLNTNSLLRLHQMYHGRMRAGSCLVSSPCKELGQPLCTLIRNLCRHEGKSQRRYWLLLNI